MAPYYAFIEHLAPIPCGECNVTTRYPSSLSYIVDGPGQARRFEDEFVIPFDAVFMVHCPAHAHEVRFQADGKTQVVHTQLNTPLQLGNTATLEE